jgi:hypothetical protein
MNRWLIISGCVLLAIGVSYNFGPDTIFFANDQALSFAVVDRALGGEIPLAGPPSHVGGRHLGPFYYWYLILTQLIGGGLHGALIVGAVFSAISVLLIGWVVGGAGGVLLAALVAVAGYLDTIRIPWHPHILLPLNALFIFSTARLFRAGPAFLGWWFLVGSILGQTHSAAVPFVVGVGAVVLLWLVLQIRLGSGRELMQVRASWILGLLTLAPLLIYNLVYDGNLGRLFQTHAHAEETVGAGFKAALIALYDFLGQHVLGGSWNRSLGLAFVSWLGFGVLLEKSSRERIWQTLNEGRWILGAVLSGSIFTTIALSRFKPPIYDYYWSVLLPVPLILGAWCARFISISSLRSYTGVATWIPLGIVLLYSAVVGVIRYGDRPFVRQHTLGSAERVVDGMRRLSALGPNGSNTQIVTRLYASSMKNTYNFLLSSERFNQLEVSYKFKEFADVPTEDLPEGKYSGNWRYVVFCPVPFSKELKRMMSGFRKKWALVGQEIVEGELPKDRCLVRLLSRKSS